MVAALTLFLFVGLSACRTSRVESQPIAPIRASSADAAWKELLRIRRDATTLTSYATIRISTAATKRSFHASILADTNGRLRVSGFSPVGTEVFTLYADGGSVTFADHSNHAWWKGSFADVVHAFGLPEELTAREFSMLALGLPAEGEEGEAAEESDVRQGAITYALTATGLSGAAPESKSWAVSYEPASFPPQSVTFAAVRAGAPSITIRHLDFGQTDQPIEPLAIDSSYRCCAAPGW